ncbi:MAG: polyprenyl synthetase family protein, partial [Mariprofundus sp.]
ECLEVIERKTAVLFKAASEVGAHAAGQSADVVAAMAEYGMCLGVAFQLMDDALNYLAEAEEAGKPVGHDLEEGKITLPLIHAMRGDSELAARVEEIAERGAYEEGDRQWVRERVAAQGGSAFAMARAKDYAERAKTLLPQHADSKIRNLLAELADFSAHRPY